MRTLPENFKPLPVGVSDFKEIIEKGYYYVDKTLLLKELMDFKGKVNLFTRPRRFGKTLNLSMLKYFFEDTMDEKKNQENKRLFSGLKVMDMGDRYAGQMCRYPVISLTLKSAKQGKFEVAYDSIVKAISEEFKRHRYLLDSEKLSGKDKQVFLSIADREAGYSEYASALKFLSGCLYEHTGKKSVILIDEYDVPLEAAHSRGFYVEMVDFIRSLFESALKDNLSLEFAVITGCLRISKESIFTGLNNLKVISIQNRQYSEHFGFLEKEVKQIMEFYGCPECFAAAKEWYDGYCFGDTDIYNPWSIIQFASCLAVDKTAKPQPYWASTSSNSIVKDVLVKTDDAAREQVETLVSGGTILIQVREEVTYEDIEKKKNNSNDFWNFLFLTGYLTKAKSLSEQEIEEQGLDIDQHYLIVRIPNREVRSIYKNVIRSWFQEVTVDSKAELYAAVLGKEEKKVRDILNHMLMKSISTFDSAESFYHGFMLGLFQDWGSYKVVSNRESGTGRSDLVLWPKNLEDPGIVMEFKYVQKKKEVLPACDMALKQIEEKQYDYELLDDGYDVIRYGICFCGKSCMVKLGE